MKNDNPLERVIEGAAVARAKALGLPTPIKCNGLGHRADPDRLFIGPHGRYVFVEFKRRGAKPTPLQTLRHAELRAAGHPVAVVDNKLDAQRLVEKIASTRDDCWERACDWWINGI